MTVQEYIDEVMVRLYRHNVVLQLSEPQILTYINRARRIVQKYTIGLYPERYGNVTEITIPNVPYTRDTRNGAYNIATSKVWQIDMPIDFIDLKVAVLQYVRDGVRYRAEARQATKREIMNMSDHAWNVPTPLSPVCCAERRFAAGYEYILYLAGLDVDGTTTLFDIASNIEIEVWYTSALDDLEDYLNDTEVPIPPSVEELVVYYALLFCLQNIQEQGAYQTVLRETRQLESLMAENFELSYMKQEQLIPSKEG